MTISIKKSSELSNYLIAFLKALTYKSGVLAFTSGVMSFLVQFSSALFDYEVMGVSFSFLALAIVLTVFDFILGLSAAKKQQQVIRSSKFKYTFFKLVSLFLFITAIFVLSEGLAKKIVLEEGEWLSLIYSSTSNIINMCMTFGLFLYGSREFISIGENITKIAGKKPVLFEYFERIFDIINLKFWSKLKQMLNATEEDVCPKIDDDEKENLLR